uniref:DH domain-containing protein n=1 Tax=Petromyzon marinus TaxID=7757 RepID=S4R4G1_PETMA
RQQMERRLRVLEELLETERDFLCDLRVFRKRVFVPLQQVRSVTLGLPPKVNSMTKTLTMMMMPLWMVACAGSVFLGVRDEVEGVYKSYCAHHEQGLAEMEMWSHDPHSCDCLQASITALRCFHREMGKRRLVDVPSFLILPVQRVTRYPLLLTEL